MQVDVQQNTPEWLSLRRSKIGASDASVILGINPWRSEKDLWEEKLGLKEDQPQNEAMKLGHELESRARDEFVRQIGVFVTPKVFQSPSHDYMIASLDGIDDRGTLAVEIKCSQKIYYKTCNGEIDPIYTAQVQHQMEVASLDKIYFFAWWDNKYKLMEIKRDQVYIDRLIEKEFEFYQRMIKFIPPEPKYIERKDPEWLDKACQYKEASLQAKQWEQREKELRDSLISMAGQSNVQGAGIRMSKIVRKGNIDLQELVRKYNINDAESFRKPPIVSWRIESE